MKKISFLFLSFIFLVAIACKKDKTTIDILTSKSWKPSINDKNPALTPGIPGVNVSYYPVQECDKDDTYTFAKNGKLTINYGSNKCVDDQPTTLVLDYSYNRANNELIIDGQKFTVISEKTEQLKYYAPLPHNTGYEYVVHLLE